MWIIHTAWIRIWMTKRPGTNSDNSFILKIRKKNYIIKETKRSYGRFWIYQLISTANSALILIGSVFLFSLVIFICFFEYKIIVRTSAWSFVIQIPIQAVFKDKRLSCFQAWFLYNSDHKNKMALEFSLTKFRLEKTKTTKESAILLSPLLKSRFLQSEFYQKAVRSGILQEFH